MRTVHTSNQKTPLFFKAEDEGVMAAHFASCSCNSALRSAGRSGAGGGARPRGRSPPRTGAVLCHRGRVSLPATCWEQLALALVRTRTLLSTDSPFRRRRHRPPLSARHLVLWLRLSCFSLNCKRSACPMLPGIKPFISLLMRFPGMVKLLL